MKFLIGFKSLTSSYIRSEKMRIAKHYSVRKPELEGPHEFYGKFTCNASDERESNYLSRFAEAAWPRYAGQSCVVSFAPTDSESVFWVNGKTSDIVRRTIDRAVHTINDGLKKAELQSADA
jgi:hypothetical protein